MGSEYFRTLVPAIAPSGLGSIFFSEFQGRKIASALVVYFGHTAMYYYGGSRAEHRNVMAPYLLHFEIMRKAKALGCRYYDFGGVAPQSTLDNRWTDISIFKRKFGGREVHFVPTLEYIYDPAAYHEWEALKRDRRSDQGRERQAV
jgi:lipid II:glycine glycyltransferase (peptidoglycan interpeptide bridge formation enzyme)